MTQTLVAIGTRKGLWLARSTDRDTWSLDGPHGLDLMVGPGAVVHILPSIAGG
jgi:hypothetical protein